MKVGGRPNASFRFDLGDCSGGVGDKFDPLWVVEI